MPFDPDRAVRGIRTRVAAPPEPVEIWEEILDFEDGVTNPTCSVCSREEGRNREFCSAAHSVALEFICTSCCDCAKCRCGTHIMPQSRLYSEYVGIVARNNRLDQTIDVILTRRYRDAGTLRDIRSYLNRSGLQIGDVDVPDIFKCSRCWRDFVTNSPFEVAQYEEVEADETVRKEGWVRRTGSSYMNWTGDTAFQFQEGTDCPRMPGDVLIGVELECESGGSRDLVGVVQNWGGRVQSDGSVAQGFEIATPPASGDKFVQMIDEITHAAKAAHGLVTQRCGLHAHIDCRDLTPEQILLLTGLWCLFEHQFFAMMPPSRRGQNTATNTWYCRPLSPRWRAMQALATGNENVAQMLGFLINRKFTSASYADAERYKAWNLSAMVKYTTTEVRLHSGTLQADKIIPWACILASLKRAVIRHSRDELIAQLSQPKPTNEVLFDLMYSTEAREYIVKRQGIFRQHNNPDDLLMLFNPLPEYKQALRLSR